MWNRGDTLTAKNLNEKTLEAIVQNKINKFGGKAQGTRTRVKVYNDTGATLGPGNICAIDEGATNAGTILAKAVVITDSTFYPKVAVVVDGMLDGETGTVATEGLIIALVHINTAGDKYCEIADAGVVFESKTTETGISIVFEGDTVGANKQCIVRITPVGGGTPKIYMSTQTIQGSLTTDFEAYEVDQDNNPVIANPTVTLHKMKYIEINQGDLVVSCQLADGTEVAMPFSLPDRDGIAKEFSTGTILAPDSEIWDRQKDKADVYGNGDLVPVTIKCVTGTIFKPGTGQFANMVRQMTFSKYGTLVNIGPVIVEQWAKADECTP